ncbi:ATP-binding cassette domain-containing protein [Cognatiyoonia sp. IB215182]|nr:ATP-binding cassette domain-containing protein [Cognatiyoonia sp. IB215182]
MSNNADGLLKIDALSAEISGRAVLDDINLEVARSEWLAIVGGSGAGKSTLLRAIMGLKRPARPTSGEMHFEGAHWRFSDCKPFRPKAMSFVPQSPAYGFDPLRRLHWQLAQLARRIRGSQQDNRALFDTLSLPDPAQKYPHEWSRGMQQRLLLAMALMEQPSLLILDEPTSALDPIIAAQVLQEVQRIAAAQGIAVIIVTHDLALAARYAHKIVIMEHGRIVEAGRSDIVLTRPQTAYARELVAHRHWHSASIEATHAAS